MFKKKKQWSVLENEVGRKSGTQGSSYDSLSISLGKLPLHLCISAVPSLQQKCFIRWHPVTVFILFHQLLFCLRDLMRLLTYKLKKSWVDHYLVLFSSQQIVVLNHLLQPSWSLISLILLPANCCTTFFNPADYFLLTPNERSFLLHLDLWLSFSTLHSLNSWTTGSLLLPLWEFILSLLQC